MMYQKVLMKETRRGFFDRFRPFCLKAGEVVSIPISFAKQLIEKGIAEPEPIEQEKPSKRKKKNEKS